MKPLLVPNDFDRNILARLVIVTLGDLSERSFAKHVQDFISVRDVVVVDNEVVASLIIKT